MACHILLDEQLMGYSGYLNGLAHSGYWHSISEGLEFEFTNFQDCGLKPGLSDRAVWLYCQEHQLYLLTDNRNMEGENSLEEVLRTLNGPDSLPVFTIGDRSRFHRDRSYGERLIEKRIEKLIDSEIFLGVGRIYVPY